MEVHFRMRARLGEGKDGPLHAGCWKCPPVSPERGLKPLQSSKITPIKVVSQRRSKRSGFKPEASSRLAGCREAHILGRGGEGKRKTSINLTHLCQEVWQSAH
jgi:hypothetical protein